MEPVTIEATARQDLGAKHAKKLRREGQIPCEMYGDFANLHFSAPTLAFRDLIYTNVFRTAKVKLDGKEYVGFVKDVQYHPTTDQILHIDFQQLVKGKPVVTHIPIQITGNSKGVRDGGVLIQKLRKLKVKAEPESLKEAIEVDVSDLELGKSINVRELSFESMEILELSQTPIARVAVPRAAVKDATAEGLEEGEEGAEGTEEGGGEGEAAAAPAEGGGE